jgi:hypothetical protein
MSTFYLAGGGKPMQLRPSSTSRRQERRFARSQARSCQRAGLPEAAAYWRKKARNV